MKTTLLTLFALTLASQPLRAGHPPSWTRAIEPARLVGNVHYVGTEDLGAYLIAGKEGLILLDAPLEENVDLVLANVRKLGFDPGRIRILLNSHAHADHAGGLAEVKRRTGAQVYMSKDDAELAARGGLDDFAFDDDLPYPPVTTDQIVRDGEAIRLGDVSMTPVLTPGHTKGCTTWTTTVMEGEKALDVVFLCSVSAPGYRLVQNEAYPEIFEDYQRSFARLGELQADVFLANHGSFFGLKEKLAKSRAGTANPFIDAGALPRFLDRAWQSLLAEKQKQER